MGTEKVGVNISGSQSKRSWMPV